MGKWCVRGERWTSGRCCHITGSAAARALQRTQSLSDRSRNGLLLYRQYKQSQQILNTDECQCHSRCWRSLCIARTIEYLFGAPFDGNSGHSSLSSSSSSSESSSSISASVVITACVFARTLFRSSDAIERSSSHHSSIPSGSNRSRL